MQITVCGGGNAAHVLAGLLGSQKGVSLCVYAPFENEAARWQQGLARNGGITVHTPTGNISGSPAMVTNDPRAAVQDAALVLLALPAFAHQAILELIAPYLTPGAWIGAMPARGGFDLCVRDILRPPVPHVVAFGLQTLPWACRIRQYGEQVSILGIKNRVDVAVSPFELAPLVASNLQAVLGVTLTPVGSLLALTLADAGQLIHPGIMYGLFHDWRGELYPAPPLFYQGVDAFMADLLHAMSGEVLALRNALEQSYPELDLACVRPLGEWLERAYPTDIADKSTLQTAFVSNRSYAGLRAPVQEVRGGYVPDFQARYLAEDVPFGLAVTRGIAELAGVETLVIDRVLVWAQARLGKNYLVGGKLQGADVPGTRAPQRYGLSTLEDLMQAMHPASAGADVRQRIRDGDLQKVIH